MDARAVQALVVVLGDALPVGVDVVLDDAGAGERPDAVVVEVWEKVAEVPA